MPLQTGQNEQVIKVSNDRKEYIGWNLTCPDEIEGEVCGWEINQIFATQGLNTTKFYPDSNEIIRCRNGLGFRISSCHYAECKVLEGPNRIQRRYCNTMQLKSGKQGF